LQPLSLMSQPNPSEIFESELEYRLQELQAQCFRAEELFRGYADGLDEEDDDL